jgi:replicative DNA helicase
VSNADFVRASGRMPPQDMEAEQAVLGSILLDNEKVHVAIEKIRVEDFYRSTHQRTFRAMVALAEKSEPIDILTLSDQLRRTDELDAAGGPAYIAGLAEFVPSSANVEHYIRLVREKSLLRQLGHASSAIANKVHEQHADVNAFIDEAEKAIYEVGRDRARTGFVQVRAMLRDSLKTIEKISENRNAVTGVSTGFSEIDKMTSGLQPGELIIVAGRPSMGKTAFALNIAENAAMCGEAPVPVAVFSLEMATEQLVMRLLTSQGRVDASKLRSGYANQKDLDRIVMAADRLSRAPIFIDDTAGISLLEMRAKSRRLASEQKIGLVVVDYLQLMRGTSTESREREVAEISRGLKALAKELRVPVIAISQLNRAVEARADKRPMLSDLRESGAVEQDSDVIAFVYRDEYYNKETDKQGVAEIIIAKQRNGPTGTAEVRFFREFTRFENLHPEDQG